jgi:predicted amidophosphoribosyltransferase
MITIQDQATSNNNYKKHILKDQNITNNICRKCREKLETIQIITGACHAPAQGDYTHCHNEVANIVHPELAIKCGLSKKPPMPYYKYEPQSVLENSNY